MVQCATLFTLFMATVAFARKVNHNKRSCIRPSQTVPNQPSSSPVVSIPSGPSSSPAISYITVTETVTEIKTIESCSTPGGPNPGYPTNIPQPPVESSPGPLPTWVKPPAVPSSPIPSSSSPNPEGNPPTTLPSSTVVNSLSPLSPAPIPSGSSSSSVASSPASSAPQPTYTGKYDRNAICGNQKRAPSPLEAVADFSKRNLHRKSTH